MQEGIGRSGYRLIALVFFGLGVLGLAAVFVAFGPSAWYEWLGYGLVATALVALVTLALQVLAVRPAASPRGVLESEPGLLPTPLPLPPAPAADPSADLGVEYADEDVQPMDLEPLPPVSIAPPEQPRAPIVVPPRRPQGDTKGWPARPEPSGVTRGEQRKREREQPRFEREAREPPLVMARTAASAEATGIPDNVSLGKCGNCGVLLLAPKKRPIKLQCPRCERVHTMT